MLMAILPRGVFHFLNSSQDIPPADLPDEFSIVIHDEEAFVWCAQKDIGGVNDVGVMADRPHDITHIGIDRCPGAGLVVIRVLNQDTEAVFIVNEADDLVMFVQHRCTRDAALQQGIDDCVDFCIRPERDQVARHVISDRGSLQ